LRYIAKTIDRDQDPCLLKMRDGRWRSRQDLMLQD
jgi:hypothetical protein